MSHTEVDKSLLEKEISKFEDCWLKLLESALLTLDKFLTTEDKVPLIPEKIIVRQAKSWSILETTKPDFYYWILKHREDIVNLPEYKKCIEDMRHHKILGKYNEYYFETVLLPFVSDYLENARSSSFDKKIFENLYPRYMNALFSLFDEFLILCPLFNFESEIEELILDDGLMIRRLREDELNELWNSSIYFLEDLRHRLPEVKFIIEYRVSKVRLGFPVQSISGDPLIDVALFDLRLLKTGMVWGSISFGKSLLPWKKPIRGMAMLSMQRKSYESAPYGDKYILKTDEISPLKKLYLISKFALKSEFLNEYKHLSRGIKWFNKLYNEQDNESKIMWLIFLIEALCSEAGDTKYKLSNRVAMFIGKNDDERVRIQKNFAKIYREPRNIVHGKEVTIEREDILLLEDFARKLIKIFISLSLNVYDREKALSLVDRALLSEKERNILTEVGNLDKIFDRLEHTISPKPKEDNALFVIIEEIKSIKNTLEIFGGYQHKSEFEKNAPLHFGLAYESVKLHGLVKTVPEELWARISGFYEMYRSYLILLNKSISLVRSIIQDEARKIKTEKEAEEWKQRVLTKLREVHSPNIADVGGPNYLLEEFLKYEKPHQIPQLIEDQCLYFDSSYSGWDMRLSIEDLSRGNLTLSTFLGRIHAQVNKEDLIKKVRKRKVEMLQLVASLITEIETTFSRSEVRVEIVI